MGDPERTATARGADALAKVSPRARRQVRSAYHRTREAAWQATRRWRALPDFVVIGAQKAGTTSVFRALTQCCSVVPPLRKEVHYLDYATEPTTSRYRGYFPLRSALGGVGACGPLVTGEASPYMLAHPMAPGATARIVPDACIVAILRDPVERAVSHYRMARFGLKRESRPFHEAVLGTRDDQLRWDDELAAGDRTHQQDHALHSYYVRGLYTRQLGRWRACFPDAVVLDFDELVGDPSVLAGLRERIGLAPTCDAVPALGRRNASRATDQWEPEPGELAALAARYALDDPSGFAPWADRYR